MMLKNLVGALAEPVPTRFLMLRLLDKGFGFLSYKDKIRLVLAAGQGQDRARGAAMEGTRLLAADESRPPR